MPRKKKKPDVPQEGKSPFHERLKGFDIRLNPFGEMESTFDIDKINSFLDDHVPDKKLGHDDDFSEEE